MSKRLFLLDAMALAYRAHFAFVRRPIRTSEGINTSALFGFANTLLVIIEKWEPTHMAVAFDTAAPTARHREYPAYKAHREAMPEELSAALPHLQRLIEAFRIQAVALDGYEADDLIGTLARRADGQGFETYMVTPDKDFGQLVDEHTFLWKPGRQGSDVELLKPEDIRARWGIERPEQVVDMLGLMGDASDNIPGVPGVGEKTAAKLIARYGSLEATLASADEVKGRVGDALREHADQARLSRRLATIVTDVPLPLEVADLSLRPRDDEALRSLCVEFELSSLGRKLFGNKSATGRAGGKASSRSGAAKPEVAEQRSSAGSMAELDLPGLSAADTPSRTAGSATGRSEGDGPPLSDPEVGLDASHRTLADTPHEYELVDTPRKLAELIERLSARDAFCFDTETDGLDWRTARLLGIAFSFGAGTGCYVPVRAVGTASGTPDDGGRDGASERTSTRASPLLVALAPVFEDAGILKVGHNLKFDLLILGQHGIAPRGPLFDTMIAHALVEPEQRHGLDYCAEVYLDYSPVPIERLIGPKGAEQRSMAEAPVEQVAEYAAEDADVTWRLRDKLMPLLEERGAKRVFYEVEMPVLPAIVAMETEGVRLDAKVLTHLSVLLGKRMAEHEKEIRRLAGREFNVNSNKQLGEVLFDHLELAAKPRKTRTGQYATDENTLQSLAGRHDIVSHILEYRAVAKLKSTYADALPAAISAKSGRVHTTFMQTATATGRLSSRDPNLQNIPIRTELGQEIRRAFVARESETKGEWLLLSADYSQIELRIIASVSQEEAMIEAFERGEDIHTATAARVFDTPSESVTPEQRHRAKMVNFGIAYGISAFGLAQRLAIPRKEAGEIIEHYFTGYSGIRRYIDATLEFARTHGYVETLTGRRRYLRDIESANASIRGAAERNAVNMPIQGAAADMIKLAMARIQTELARRELRTRMVLQVHDELVFDLFVPEETEIRQLVEENMKNALPLDVPIEVGIDSGPNWLEAH